MKWPRRERESGGGGGGGGGGAPSSGPSPPGAHQIDTSVEEAFSRGGHPLDHIRVPRLAGSQLNSGAVGNDWRENLILNGFRSFLLASSLVKILQKKKKKGKRINFFPKLKEVKSSRSFGNHSKTFFFILHKAVIVKETLQSS